MAELPSGTVTFLFTDIEGSTQLVKRLRGAYAHLLVEHQRVLRAAFEEGGGREIDTQGDAFFVVFTRAMDAVLTAAAAQRDLANQRWPEDAEVRVRMGIHSGEPTIGGDRYIGLGVHRASRICAAAHGGQVLLSNVTRELVEDDLPPDVQLLDLGEQRLKDIDRAEHLYQVLGPGLRTEFPPLRASSEVAFGGREGELAAAAGAAVKPVFARGLRSRRSVLVACALLLAAVIALGTLLAVGAFGGGGGTVVHAHGLGVIDPVRNEVVDAIDLPNHASGLAGGAGALWVADGPDGTVLRIDPDSRRIAKTIGVGLAPDAVAARRDEIWVAEHAGTDNFASLQSIDPVTGQGGRPRRLRIGGASVVGLVADEDGVWLGLQYSGVYWIDGASGQIRGPVSSSTDASALAFGDGALWIAEQDDDVVSRVEPATQSVQVSIPIGEGEPNSMALGAGWLWVADAAGNKVWRIDPVRNEVYDTIPVGRSPAAIAIGDGAVWVANRGDGTVSRIDPKEGKVVASITVGTGVDQVAASDGVIWASIP
jgi:YVTN family beta-propeller protein